MTSISLSNVAATMVKKAGDTMTGNLTIGGMMSCSNIKVGSDRTYNIEFPYGAVDTTNRRYAFLGTVNLASGYVNIKGMMGGHESGVSKQDKVELDVTIDARNARIFGNVRNINYTASNGLSGLVVYRDASGDFKVYLTGGSFFRMSLEVTNPQSTAALFQEPLVWSADQPWTDPANFVKWLDTTTNIPRQCYKASFLSINAQTSVYDVLTMDGNVGIGTSNPSSKLNVAGDINFTGNLLQNGQSNLLIGARLAVGPTTSSNLKGRFCVFSGDRHVNDILIQGGDFGHQHLVVQGTSYSNHALGWASRIASLVDQDNNLSTISDSNFPYHTFSPIYYEAENHVFRASASSNIATPPDVLTINGSNGNVGIGVSTPSSKLNVSGLTTLENFSTTGTEQQGVFVSGGFTGGSSNRIFTVNRQGTGNVFNVYANGNTKCTGAFTGGGADYAEYFEWEDGNLNGEDRVGWVVALTADGKVRPAVSEDADNDLLGVVSVNPSVVGNDYWSYWQGKYLRDEFDRKIYDQIDYVSWKDSEGKDVGYWEDEIPEDVVVPDDAVQQTLKREKLNPEYDSSFTYTPRSERKEWVTIGMIGKLRISNGQPVRASWRKIRTITEDVEEWLVR